MHPDDLRALAKEHTRKALDDGSSNLEVILLEFGKTILREERGRIVDDLERLVARLEESC